MIQTTINENNKIIISVYAFNIQDLEQFKKCNAIIDTGASGSTIAPAVARELNLVKENYTVPVTVGNGITEEKEVFIARIVPENHSKFIDQRFVSITPNEDCDLIIGMDLIKFSNIIINRDEVQITFTDLV